MRFLTISILSSFLRAGRQVDRSDLGLQFITLNPPNEETEHTCSVTTIHNLNPTDMDLFLQNIPQSCFHWGCFERKAPIQQCDH